MAFPVVEGSNTSAHQDGNVTNHTVSLPASIQAGELLIVVFSSHGSESVGWPAGWNEIFETAEGGGNATLAVAWREADGGEGATITVTTGTAEESGHVSLRISGAEDPDTQPPEISAGAEAASGAQPDPDNLTPTGGAEDFLWIAICGWNERILTGTDPTNYSGAVVQQASAWSDNGAVASFRDLNAASENPGIFQMSSSDAWVAATVAVHPATAANVTVTVPVASLALVGFAPTVTTTANVSVEVPVAVLALAGFAPTVTVTANISIEIPVASLTLAGFAPVVTATANVSVEVPVASLALAGFAPTVTTTANVSIEVPVASLILAGFAPTVTATGDVSITVPIASLTLVGFAPTVQTPVTVTIPVASLTLTGFAPTVQTPVSVTVPVASLSLSAFALGGFSPTGTATGNVSATVPVASLILTGFAPTIVTLTDVSDVDFVLDTWDVEFVLETWDVETVLETWDTEFALE